MTNGVFHQYFTNSTSYDEEIALRSLKAIEAVKTAEHLDRFIKIAFNRVVPFDRVERNEIIEVLEENDEVNDKLESINVAFYESEEDIGE